MPILKHKKYPRKILQALFIIIFLCPLKVLSATQWSELFPDAGTSDVVVIKANQNVILDTNVTLRGLIVRGSLEVSDDRDIELRTNWALVLAGGSFSVGSEQNPHQSNFTLTLVGTNNNLTIDLQDYTNMSGIIRRGSAFLMAMGNNAQIEMYAADGDNKATWAQLSRTANAGTRRLRLNKATQWKVGDSIAIASSDFDPGQAEEFTIADVKRNGRVIILDRPLNFDHYGNIETYSNGRSGNNARTWNVDMRAEVARLNSNITIQGTAQADASRYGGHTMVMNGGEMRISGAEFYRLGQEGILGRYPIHWHLIGDASGQYIENSIIHHSFNKGIAVHGTQNTRMTNNVVYNTLGHSYFFEDGAEWGNRLVNNLGFSTLQASSLDDATIPSDFVAPTTFWIKNPNNTLINNHAAGSQRHGFWYLAYNEVSGLSAQTGLYNNLDPSVQPFGESRGNVAHSNLENNMMIGAIFDEQAGTQTGASAFWLNSVVELQDLTVYKGEIGIWSRVRNALNITDRYNNLKAADNLRASFFLGNSQLADSLIVGRSANDSDASQLHEGINFRLGQTWYDGKHDVEDTHFANFTQGADAALSNARGLGKGIFNEVSGLTFSNIPFRHIFSGLEKGIISDTATIAKFVVTDLDGSVLSEPGAKFTPEYVNLVAGVDYDVIEPGMNAAPNATYVPEWNGYDNPAESEIAIGTFKTNKSNINLDSFRVTRSDNDAQVEFHAGQITNPSSTWLLQMLNDDITYQIEFLNRRPNFIRFTIEGAKDGDIVTHEYLNVPSNARIIGATRVNSMNALRRSNVDSYIRLNGRLIIRLADTNGYRINF